MIIVVCTQYTGIGVHTQIYKENMIFLREVQSKITKKLYTLKTKNK